MNVGRWDEAPEIKVSEKSAIELEHEKILEMKSQYIALFSVALFSITFISSVSSNLDVHWLAKNIHC